MFMESQHCSKLESTLWFVEKLIREVEESLDGKGGIYATVETDLNEVQVKAGGI